MQLDQIIGMLSTDLLIRSTLLVCIAWLGVQGLRNAAASGATRHLVWLFGIAGLLLLPALALFLPELPVAILPPDANNPPSVRASAIGEMAPDDGTGPWSWVVTFLYLAGAAGFATRLASARWMLARLWGAAEEPDRSWQELVQASSRPLRLNRQVQLRISPEAVMPMTWGAVAPKVLLPAEARDWPAEQRRLVLMHELAHVARNDSLSQSAASVACAIYWFHPMVWFAARQMRVEQEHAADNLVLAAGAQPRGYARCLLELARDLGRPAPSTHAAAAAGRSQLECRLLAIVGSGDRRPDLHFPHRCGGEG